MALQESYWNNSEARARDATARVNPEADFVAPEAPSAGAVLHRSVLQREHTQPAGGVETPGTSCVKVLSRAHVLVVPLMHCPELTVTVIPFITI